MREIWKVVEAGGIWASERKLIASFETLHEADMHIKNNKKSGEWKIRGVMPMKKAGEVLSHEPMLLKELEI